MHLQILQLASSLGHLRFLSQEVKFTGSGIPLDLFIPALPIPGKASPQGCA